jgi:rubrerythrin
MKNPLTRFRKKVSWLHTDEKKAVREYADAVNLAQAKRDRLVLMSIQKDEKKHGGKLSQILKRMKA